MSTRSDKNHPGNLRQAMHTDVDPELERQLALAADDEPVEAVLVLRQERKPMRSQSSATALLKRVCGNVPAASVESTYLPRLDILIVRARPCVIRQLIAQPEVEMACANQGEYAAALAIPGY
jgi:hypothetical protein